MKLAKMALVLSAALYANENNKLMQSALIDSLINSNFRYEYYDDGAGDGSIMEIGSNSNGRVDRPPRILKKIVDLGDLMIPFLIHHLDDNRETNLRFNSNSKKNPVTIGYVSLDILTHIIELNDSIVNPECGDDGICACFNPGYCFRPDEFVGEIGLRQPSKLVSKTKSNFQNAYKKNLIKFHFPQWWKKQ